MREPRFWSVDVDPHSREAAPVTRALLTPLSIIYAAITARRIASSPVFEAGIPVICVGNLTAGGVGKSPIVLTLQKHLMSLTGLRIASLSRGYGGSEKGPLKVDLAAHTARDVGDEPIMHANSGECWIGADRAKAGAAMAQDGVQGIIMDDGHQNPTLHKDVSLIVVDTKARFGNGFVIPKGPLREPVSEGISRADAVILMGEGDVPNELEGFECPIIRAKVQALKPPPSGPVIAFAGIGFPEKFFDSLTQNGANVKDAVPFPDHHVYRPDDLKWLRKLALDHSARLITTEKDYARLPESDRRDILTFPVEAVFEDQHKLNEIILPIFSNR